MAWIIVILFRLLTPLTILRWPILGSILAIIADNFDVIILDYMGTTDFSNYNSWEKILDTYFALIQGFTIFFWTNKLAKKVGLGLLVYRTIGVILYELTSFRLLLFIFPNLFEFFYLFYLIYKRIFKKDLFSNLKIGFSLVFILLILKLAQEYMLHISQFPIYQWLKDNIFSFVSF